MPLDFREQSRGFEHQRANRNRAARASRTAPAATSLVFPAME
jgi:hypothetical protein